MEKRRKTGPDAEFLTRTIAGHGLWKYRLDQAIRTGTSDYRVEVIRADNQCAMGKWIHGDAARALAGDERYQHVRSLHATFHTMAADALRHALDGAQEKASRALETGSPFMATSAELVSLLDSWRHDALADAGGSGGRGSGGNGTSSGNGNESRNGNEGEAADSATGEILTELIGTSLEAAAQAELASGAGTELEERIDGLAAATEKMTVTVGDIATNASDAAQIMTNAVDSATAFTTQVTHLTEAVVEIERLLSLIDGIARQTNLLALNAAIEAARAGAAGRGFAVVAGEVKDLAGQTAGAAADVTRQTATIQSLVEQTLAGMHHHAEQIRVSQETQAAIAAAVEQQRATTTEISRNVTASARASHEIAENIAAAALAARHAVADTRRLAPSGQTGQW